MPLHFILLLPSPSLDLSVVDDPIIHLYSRGRKAYLTVW